MSSYFALRQPALIDAAEGFADIVISMHSDLQQIPIACDLVSRHFWNPNFPDGKGQSN
jgi:hypothetical protein